MTMCELRNMLFCFTMQDHTGVWNGPAPVGSTGRTQVSLPVCFKCNSRACTNIAEHGSMHRLYATRVCHCMQEGAASALSAPPQDDSLLLPSGARMPLVGFGTYKVDKVDSVRYACALMFGCITQISGRCWVNSSVNLCLSRVYTISHQLCLTCVTQLSGM